MDANETITPNDSSEEMSGGNGELSHSDKMIGVFTEPSRTFSITSKFPPRTKDWVIPVFILFLVVGFMQRIALMNEEIYYKVIQEQTSELDKQVEAGELSREEADQRAEAIETFTKGPIGWITTIAGSLIFGFIFFLLIAGFYFLSIKIFIKGEGGFSSVLVASGLTAYIGILNVILAGIFTMLLGIQMRDISVSAFLDLDRLTIIGWLLAKVDPIGIWSYGVLSIGLAKMFKADDTKKYFLLVFGSWIIVSLILFFLAQNISFFKNFL